MTTTATQVNEPSLKLPTWRLVITGVVTAFVVAVGWAVMAPGVYMAEGAVGAATVAVLSILSLLAMGPWKTRPVSTWTTAWLAALVARLFITPALAFVLYSAAPLSLAPLMLSVAATYVIVQISEAAALSLYLKRTT